MSKNISLSRIRDQIYVQIDGSEAVPVKLVWVRPTSAQGGEVSVVNDVREVAFIEDLDDLDPTSSALAREELDRHYFMPRITRVVKTVVQLGNRYFEVETDRGTRSFIVKNPYTNIRAFGEDGLLFSDVMGNLFLVPSFSRLDDRSKQEIEKVT